MKKIGCKSSAVLAVISIVVISVMLFSFGCVKKEEKEIKIGVILPLTGDVASLGVPSLNAMTMAIEQANVELKKTGHKIVLVAEDDQATPAKAVSSFQKLINVDTVKLILGPLTSSATLAVAPLAEDNKTVIFSPGSSAPSVTDAGDYVFRNELSDSFGGDKQADLAFNILNFKKMASVYINNDYGVGVHSVFRDKFTSLGGKVVASESFKQDNTDFKSILAKIAIQKPDAIFVVSHNEILNFLKQKKEIGLNIPVYTTPVFEDQKNIEKLGPLAEGVIYTFYGSFSLDGNNLNTNKFIESYKAKYGTNPTYYSALGFDAANILIMALKLANYDENKVKDELYKIKDLDGVTGITSIDKNGDVMKPVTLKTVKNGKFSQY